MVSNRYGSEDIIAFKRTAGRGSLPRTVREAHRIKISSIVSLQVPGSSRKYQYLVYSKGSRGVRQEEERCIDETQEEDWEQEKAEGRQEEDMVRYIGSRYS